MKEICSEINYNGNSLSNKIIQVDINKEINNERLKRRFSAQKLPNSNPNHCCFNPAVLHSRNASCPLHLLEVYCCFNAVASRSLEDNRLWNQTVLFNVKEYIHTYY